jgi:hypothetical protein
MREVVLYGLADAVPRSVADISRRFDDGHLENVSPTEDRNAISSAAIVVGLPYLTAMVFARAESAD